MTARTSAQALFRVFVKPAITSSQKGASMPSLQHTSCIASQPFRITHAQTRPIYAFATPKRDTNDPFKNPNHPIDEDIDARLVHHVDEEGKFSRNVPLKELLRSIDRKTYHVRVMSYDDAKVPIVKVLSAKEISEDSSIRKVQKGRKTQDDMTKELEMSWNMGYHDFHHKLKQMGQFVSNGRRVEVVIYPKVKGKKVSVERIAKKEDMLQMMEQIYQRIDEIPGAQEWKDMSGNIGTQVTMFFRLNPESEAGKAAMTPISAKLKDISAARQDKIKQKEEDKAAKKARHKERLERKKESEKSRFGTNGEIKV